MFLDKAQLLQTAKGVADAVWHKAYGTWGPKIGKLPLVEMNSRLTSTGGRAFMLCGKNKIYHPDMVERMDFSVYLMQRNLAEYVEQIIPHECAHFIAFRVYGEENHGQGWKYVMQELGVRIERTHKLETKNAAKRATR